MISTVTDLNERYEVLSKSLDDKIKGGDGKRHIVLCGGTGCLSAHSTEIMERFKELLKEKGIEDKATVNQVGCFGFCSQGPFVKIYPEDLLLLIFPSMSVMTSLYTWIVPASLVFRVV